MKIILFTPYPPTMGGGSQNLRSAIPFLKNVEVIWAYLAHKPIEYKNSIHLGAPLLDVNAIKSLQRLINMNLSSNSAKSPEIDAIVKKLLEIGRKEGAERYWTVAHYEGLSVADRLIEKGESIHLSIHDDPPFALLRRSKKYFLLQYLCDTQFKRVLQGSLSIDVTSHPMGERYRRRYGVESVAYFPYISTLPYIPARAVDGKLCAGFLGTLYTPREPKAFAKGFAIAAKRMRLKPEWHFWGLGARQQSWARKLSVPTIFHPFTPEAELPQAMSQVDFIYINYPFDMSSNVFRQTSHNAKLSSSLKVQRPIFAHTPIPSSLADFVSDCGIGIVSPTLDKKVLAQQLQVMLSAQIPPQNYVDARTRWYGEENLQRLEDALLLKEKI